MLDVTVFQDRKPSKLKVSELQPFQYIFFAYTSVCVLPMCVCAPTIKARASTKRPYDKYVDKEYGNMRTTAYLRTKIYFLKCVIMYQVSFVLSVMEPAC